MIKEKFQFFFLVVFIVGFDVNQCGVNKKGKFFVFFGVFGVGSVGFFVEDDEDGVYDYDNYGYVVGCED